MIVRICLHQEDNHQQLIATNTLEAPGRERLTGNILSRTKTGGPGSPQRFGVLDVIFDDFSRGSRG
jgi:hypothetical protein